LETDFDALDDVEKLEEEIKKIVQKHEPHVVIYKKEAQNKSFAFKKSGPDLERPLPRKQLLRLALGLAIYLAALFLGFSAFSIRGRLSSPRRRNTDKCPF
jgi:hypothetical protein